MKAEDYASAQPQPGRIQVVLVDDHPALREAVSRAIQLQKDMSLAGQAGTWREAMTLALRLRPDVLVLDLNLPDGNGWNLLEQLRAREALPATLVFSGCPEELYAARLLRAGARGYLTKGEPLGRVLAGIREVHAGHLVASAAITSQLMTQGLRLEVQSNPADSLLSLAQLSDRELQVFALLGRGLRNKEAAGCLGLSEKTVATFKVRVMEKLSLRTMAELIQAFQGWQRSEPMPDQPG